MRGSAILFLACGLMAGCQSSETPSMTSTATAPSAALSPELAPIAVAIMPVEKPTTRPTVIGTVALRGDVQKRGPLDLCTGERINDVLHTAVLSTNASKLTVVLVRRCPEGTTSEMIDVGQNLAVMDPQRNYELRDGDELVVSVAPSLPEGLARPLAADMPPAH